MRVTDVTVAETGRGALLTATVVWENARRRPDAIRFLYRDTPASDVVTAGDAVAATVFMPAMATGEDVVVEAPVSRRLLAGMDWIAEIWTSWRPKWRRPNVSAEIVDRSSLSPTVDAACFSAGVDSFFTVLRPRPEPISLLITMLGFASPSMVAAGGLERAMSKVASAAHRLGRRHVLVDTNAYVFCAAYLPTHRRLRNVQQGAVLSAMALGLGARVRRCFIASSFPIGHLRPWGSHPDVDPLWSTEATEIVHDGAEFDRERKMRLVAGSDVALDSLRVCNQTGSVDGNCRECDKCQQTALALYAVGALERCSTLGPVTPQIVRRTIIIPRHFRNFERLRERIDDPELKEAITTALFRSRARRLARPVGTLLRRAGLRH